MMAKIKWGLLAPMFLLLGCAVSYMPKGNIGTATPFYIDHSLKTKCDYCKKPAELLKIINGKKIMCHICFKKR